MSFSTTLFGAMENFGEKVTDSLPTNTSVSISNVNIGIRVFLYVFLFMITRCFKIYIFLALVNSNPIIFMFTRLLTNKYLKYK